MNRIWSLMALASVSVFFLSAITAHAFPEEVMDDNSPGSFLVFPKFDIRGDTVTQLRIVNNGENLPNSNGDIVDLKVKLNYICPGVKHVNEFCAALDRTITFTPNQTRIIDVADQNPPCLQGYVIAYVLDPQGYPVAYDFLTGSYHIYSGRSHEAENAIAIQSAEIQDECIDCDDFGANANSAFTGQRLGYGNPLKLEFGYDYKYVGTNSFTDFRAISSNPDVGSRINLLTLDVLAGMQNPAAVAFIDFWNAAEVPFSTSTEFICWEEKQLDQIDLNFLEDNLGTAYGSMLITPGDNCPLPGGCPPLLPYSATILGSITEYGDGDVAGHTLFHDLTPKSTTYQPR